MLFCKFKHALVKRQSSRFYCLVNIFADITIHLMREKFKNPCKNKKDLINFILQYGCSVDNLI